MKTKINELLLLMFFATYSMKILSANEVTDLNNRDELQNASKIEVDVLQLDQVKKDICMERLNTNGGSCFESISCMIRCKVRDNSYDGECKAGPHWFMKCYCHVPCSIHSPLPSIPVNPPSIAPVNLPPSPSEDTDPEDTLFEDDLDFSPENVPAENIKEKQPIKTKHPRRSSPVAPEELPFEDVIAPDNEENKNVIKKKHPRENSPTTPDIPLPSLPTNTHMCSALYDPKDHFCFSTTWCSIKCKIRGPNYGGECKSDNHMLKRCYCNFPCEGH